MDNVGKESEKLEFKKSTAELEEGIVSLTAMLNKSGSGEVLFGVNNNGDVVGQNVGNTTYKDISQKISNIVDPPITARIETRYSTDGKEYISVSATGRERPYACKGQIYIRCGEEDRKVPMSELRNMFIGSRDNLIYSLSNDQELTFKELCSILDESIPGHKDTPGLWKSLNLTNSEGRFNIQGQLMSDQNPTVISVVIFGGTDRTYISHRTEFSGHCLLRQVTDSLNYVVSLNETSVDVGAGIRREARLFDADAFREAWINACVHNNWLESTPPTVHIFDDRMEIISYGTKPYWLSEEDFFEGRSYPVNESLMRLFIMVGLSEHTGHGVPVIVNRYGRGSFKMSNAGITVTLSFGRERAAADLRGGDVRLTDNERMVLDALEIYPRYTLDCVAEITGLSRSYVGKVVVKLKEMGVLEREGSRKKGVWSVRKDGGANGSDP
ncbi:MAG: RNA-binding domain-containing protein [Candidatus Methanomethylophilaceae archaeon]